jgi:hypothetical protein
MKTYIVKFQSDADGGIEEICVEAETTKEAWNKACYPEWHMVVGIEEKQ